MKMTMNPFFINFHNKVYANRNWHLRTKVDDVILLEPLDTQDMGKYSKLSKQGLSDNEIYKKLYPRVEHRPKEKVLIDIDLLTKEQLIHLISLKLNASLPTLIYMSTKDLKTLYSVSSARIVSLN
jgi:hypothetical protein